MSEEKMVAIINQGAGPIDTVGGRCNPGQSVEVPESDADKLCKYAGIVRADTVVKPRASDAGLAKENAALKSKVQELEKELGEARPAHEDLTKRLAEVEAAHAAANTRVEDLTGRMREFLGAQSKKDLEALQEKHAKALAPEEPVAA